MSRRTAGEIPAGQAAAARFAVDAILMRRMGTDVLPDRASVEAWQMERLRETLRMARSGSPFHAARLAGADAGSLRTHADLPALPRTSADDIRAYAADMLCVSQDEVARAVTLDTSGTSGNPKRLFFSQQDLDRTLEFFSVGMQAVARPGDTVLALLPDGRPASVGRLLAQAVTQMGGRPISGSMELGAARLVSMARETGAHVLVGSPMHLRAFALEWAGRGLPADRIHTALLCWDVIPGAVTRQLEEILGCRVLAHWGMTETGLGGALACAPDNGMHLRESDLLAEITDPATGAQVPDGHWGELTVTTLCRTAMPLIRYRTGDWGRILPGPCACGSPLRRMDRSPGRLADDVLLPDGGVLRLIDLDEALLPMREVAAYSARWSAEAEPERERTVPGLEIVLSPVPDAGFSTDMCREAALGLRQSGVLAHCLAQGRISLKVTLASPAADGKGAAEWGGGFAKRRILRLGEKAVQTDEGAVHDDVA